MNASRPPIPPSVALDAALAALREGRVAEGLAALRAAVSAAVKAGELAGADAALAEALRRMPRQPSLLAQRAALAALAGARSRARALAHEALALDPGEPMAAVLAGDAELDAGRPSAALAIAEACLAREPAAGHVDRVRAAALTMLGRAPEARGAADRALARLGPNPAALSAALMASLYDDTLPSEALAARHRELGGAIEPLGGRPPARRRLAAPGPARIRLGVLSPDLRDHPMGWFATPLLAGLDRSRFAIHVYARVARPDATTARLKALPDLVWRDTAALDDGAVYDRIRADDIELLLDLAGHTDGGRPRLIAARAAPLQLAWLGYPYPPAIAALDGFIADAATVPAALEPLHPGRVLRLEGCGFCLPLSPSAPAVAPAPAAAGRPFTFGSLNHLAKLSDATLALWAEVLAAVPGARLALCAIPLAEAATREALRSRAARAGIDPARLVLLEPRTPLAALLRYYEAIDLALDPLPFNGATTTIQALWQGVPVLTLPGRTFQARMGLSILEAAGLADAFVARDRADYVARAAACAAAPMALAARRASLRAQVAASPLADESDFARRFGALLARAAGRA